jgi:dTDP-4-dehydrorhamnose reductase
LSSLPDTKFLIIGGTGMLGRAWRELLAREGIGFSAPPRAELDLTRPATLAQWIDSRFGVVVNCSAWTDVDGAEKDEAAAEKVNGAGVGDLMQRVKAAGTVLVHYSTDYLFEGRGTPIRVDTVREPINAYGRSKATGEVLIEKIDPTAAHHLLIRTSWLYAPWSKNFVRTIASAARTRPSLKVVNDQRGRPTSSENLARVSLALLGKNARGAFHVTDGGECTWFDFAVQIAKVANPGCKVEPCTTAEFPRPARRPAYSVLDLSKTERLVGPMTDWRTALGDVMKRLE